MSFPHSFGGFAQRGKSSIFTPLDLAEVVAWGDPSTLSASGIVDHKAGGFWTSPNLPTSTIINGKPFASFNGIDQRVNKDTSLLPTGLGVGFAAWVNLQPADVTELIFDAGSPSIRVFRGNTATTCRTSGTFQGNPTVQSFIFNNSEMDNKVVFFYVAIDGDNSACLIDGVAPASLIIQNNSGTDHFPDTTGAFFTNTAIAADTANFNFAELNIWQYYGLAGPRLTGAKFQNLMNYENPS